MKKIIKLNKNEWNLKALSKFMWSSVHKFLQTYWNKLFIIEYYLILEVINEIQNIPKEMNTLFVNHGSWEISM